MSMGGEGRVEVEYQAGKFVLLYNENINLMNKDNWCADILQRGIE